MSLGEPMGSTGLDGFLPKEAHPSLPKGHLRAEKGQVARKSPAVLEPGVWELDLNAQGKWNHSGTPNHQLAGSCRVLFLVGGLAPWGSSTWKSGFLFAYFQQKLPERASGTSDSFFREYARQSQPWAPDIRPFDSLPWVLGPQRVPGLDGDPHGFWGVCEQKLRCGNHHRQGADPCIREGKSEG